MRAKLLGGLLFASLVTLTTEVRAQANTSLSNLATPTAVNTHLLPGTNATYDLGSSALNWRSIYFSDTIFLRGYKFISGDNNFNTSFGIEAGLSSTMSHNVSVGYRALNNIGSTGFNNVGVGSQALSNIQNGNDNVAIGKDAGLGITYTGWNVAIGTSALGNGDGDGSIAIGFESLYNGGYNNIGMGNYALWNNTWGHSNVGVGYESIYSNAITEGNTALGTRSLWHMSGGGYNVSLGANSMIGTSSAGTTVAVGSSAGHSLTSSFDNIFIGGYATSTASTVSNSIAIGSVALVTASDQVRIGGPSTASIGGYVGWTNLSDGRYKKNLKEDVPGLSFITKLQPVTYTLDLDGLDKALKAPLNDLARKAFKGKAAIPERKTTPEEAASRAKKAQYIYTGFVAQDVEKAATELGYNFSGVDAPKNGKDFYGLRYAEFVVPLVKAVQELNEQNAALEERVKKLEDLILKNSGNQAVVLSGAKLEQNAPNPFNGNTVIGYTIPVGEKAGRLVITDMKGSVVKAINVNGNGKIQLTLNRGTLAAGEYIYSLWVGETKVDSKRMSVK